MIQAEDNGSQRERSDDVIRQILEVLADYQDVHPDARIEARRQNPVAVRVRIVDPDFRGKNRIDREPEVWALLERLPDETLSELTMLLLLTPEEAPKSFASHEFDHPIPSHL